MGINYDRTIEDRSLLRARDRDAARRSWWFVLWTTTRFIAHSLVLMAGIARVIPVLPVSLVSTVFLEAQGGDMDILEIEKRSNQVIDELKAEGAPIFEVPRSTRARTIADAVEFLRMRRLISVSGHGFKAVPEEEAILRYYANSIGHWR